MTRVAILGGGPSGMFMFKRLLESNNNKLSITVFERKNELGSGMPYSIEGANKEHITNVSANEIPLIVTSIAEWIHILPEEQLAEYGINRDHFNEYKVLPRLLFGQYLKAQFEMLQKAAVRQGLPFEVLYNSEVTDIIDHPEKAKTTVEINSTSYHQFDKVIVCTGHNWPRKNEGVIPGYFDSPYPPSKLSIPIHHPVAIKGSSLTAVDAIRTLARQNGTFLKDEQGKLRYELNSKDSDFRLVLHTRNGMLPAVRFHLEDSHLHNDKLLTRDEIFEHINKNDGFLSLDYIFEQDFKLPIKEKKPEFYAQIKDMSIEEFVQSMMALREHLDPFILLKAEYTAAEKSIKRKESIYWKEMLGVLSFAMNYPAKYLSAEDMQRLKKTLLPLISIVIAYIPQRSAEELMALHDASLLELIPVGEDSEVVALETGGIVYKYKNEKNEPVSNFFSTFVDCIGQPHFKYEDFPYKGLINNKTVSPARIRFKSSEEGQKAKQENEMVTETTGGNFYLKVSGIAINDSFQVLDEFGVFNERIYVMAVPYIGGYNPDYSGLDFSEAASEAISKKIFS